MNRLFFLASVVLISITACKNEGCNDPMAFNYEVEGTSKDNCVWAPIEVELNVSTTYGDDELIAGETELNTDDGRKLVIDHFGVYITEIQLVSNGVAQKLTVSSSDCIERDDDVLLLSQATKTYVGLYLPNAETSIQALRFNVGVDSCRNKGLDPTTKSDGPFAPQVPTMYWAWASGFRFVSISGRVDTSANGQGAAMDTFEYHTGLSQLLRTVDLGFEELSLMNGKLVINLNLDFKKVLEGVDFDTELVTHTMDNMPLAMKISDNMQTAFSIE